MKKITFISLCLVGMTANAENAVVKQARQAGIKHCLPVIESVSDFIISGKGVGVHSVHQASNPDKQGFSAIIVEGHIDSAIVTNLNVTHAKTGQCYLEYEKIFTQMKSCSNVQKEHLKNAKLLGKLAGTVSTFKENNADIYLIPSGSNCIIIKKEVVGDGQKK